MSIFNFANYKDFLKHEFKRISRRGILSETARAAGCSHSYISQVLNGKPDLTLDQGLSIAESLSFSEQEIEYFLLLIQASRASSFKLKKRLERQIAKIQKNSTATLKAVEKTTHGEIQRESRDFYYSDWLPMAVHTLTACEDYQNSAALAKRLDRSVKDIERVIKSLMDYGLVENKRSRHIHSGGNIHLSTRSIHNKINHFNWRQKSLESFDSEDSIHYTSVFALSRKDWIKLKKDLVDFLQAQREQIGQSGSEEAYVFCCDLFEV